MAVTTSANTDLLRAHLGAEADRVSFSDAAAWFATPGRTCAAYHNFVAEHLSHPGARARVLAEAVWASREAAEVREWVRFESTVDPVFASAPLRVMCCYDGRSTPDWVAATAGRTHRCVCVDGRFEPSPSYTDFHRLIDQLEQDLSLPSPAPGALEVRVENGLAPMRRSVREWLEAAGLDTDRIERALYAAHELAVNLIEHSAGRGPLRVWVEGGRCLLELHDEAGGRPLALAGYRRPLPDSEGGWGLVLVRQFADYVQIAHGKSGTTIRLTLSCGC